MKCAAPLAVPLLIAGCAGPLSTLEPSGPAARDIAWLWWSLLAGAAALALMVFVLVGLGFGRPRDIPESRWVFGMGVWFSLGVITVTLAATLWVGERLLPRGDALEVTAHARQWSWTFSHPGRDGPVETDSVLHIPAGRPVDVVITSTDVIHSFWVPQLAGKLDAIPGRANRLRIEAAAPGTYEGLCAEFCGLEHGTMRFDVVAHDPADWPPQIGEGVRP